MPDNSPSVWWTDVRQALTRPYPVTIPMIVLVSLVPLYVFIAYALAGRPLHAPAIALDAFFPLEPYWAIVYGCLYLYLIALPLFVIRRPDEIRTTVYAYLLIWLTAYTCFILYPTRAPRPPIVSGSGFAVAGLKFLYDADPPFNCFPSLHVAHSFVSAFACVRVHRRVGLVALIAAALVALSTLFTKQHYVLDVIAGIALASVAYAVLLRGDPRTPELDRRVAPALAMLVAGGVGVLLAGAWGLYLLA